MISGRMCMASNVNTELLRTQLDQLHSEAYSTRRKANNTRFRLIRLSEAAENLCRQAAKSLRMGQENDARELLVHKKKVMLALEKSKDRVELLDELAAKLNEAISIKESQLVETVTSDLEIDGNGAASPVHIVSPTPGSVKSPDEKTNISVNYSDIDEDQELNPDEATRPPEIFNCADKAITDGIYSGMSSYTDFLNDIDQQLQKIENGLVDIPEPSISDLKEEKSNSTVVQISEILGHVRDTRARIHNLIENIEGIN